MILTNVERNPDFIRAAGLDIRNQYFTPDRLQEELSAAGFSVEHMSGDLKGEPLKTNGDYIGVIASFGK